MLRALFSFLLGRPKRVRRRPYYPQPQSAPPARAARPTPSVPTAPPKIETAPPAADRTPSTRTLKGKCYVIDGDTIVISGTRIRIAGIDAPELDHPYGKKAKSAVISMCKGQIVTAEISEEVSYDRIVAKCYLPDGSDIAAKLVEQGLALDWPKFSGGAYRHLEPEGARKKLWRSAAKHRGHLTMPD